MFEILFGWSKASKCKKLIRRVQCRLKLLKNKRSCIVKQLRNDVAELIKYGLHQTAFQRVDQLIKDNNIVQVYDLLDQYCEFIIINLPYIRKHKDCPNDINEAASTLVFSSARFGELPELISIRKLFKERYGQRFVTVALELQPGNLVNHQIKESLYMKKMDDNDDDKYRLLDEIANSCIEPCPLLLEYKPEWQKDQANKDNNSISNCEVQIQNNMALENKEISKESSSIGIDKLTIYRHKSLQRLVETESSSSSSSDTLTQLPEELIYLDDIEEFVSPVSKNGILQDQRLFKFKSFGVPSKEKTEYGIQKNKQASRKRMRRRSLSRENRVSIDTQCAIYYGAWNENSPDHKRKSYRHKRERINKSLDFVKKGRGNEENCSTKNPCYLCNKDENYSLEIKDLSINSQQPYMRAMTMPNERPNESLMENIFRSNSYSFESGYSSCRHIHPKLPDYDELAAKFEALKKENLRKF